jgi:predicted ATPase
MYLTAVKFKKSLRCFSEGEIFNLQPITLLVGDQGCGKSTLLELLARNDDKVLNVTLTEETVQKGVESFYFDSEKMNPRVKDPISYTNIDGTNRGIGLGAAVHARFRSHGETQNVFTNEALKTAKDCVIFLDEPESGLSLRNQFRLTHEIANAAKRNCQIIVATHSLVLIQSVNDVLSLEHKKWMNAAEFVAENCGEKNGIRTS